MKKNLLTLGALVLTFAANAQVLTHVDKDALVYVSKDALVYNGGGLKVKDTGKWENHGNVMVVGGASDVFATVDASNAAKTDGGNFYNRVNDTETGYNYGLVGTDNTYGQLYISGLTQSNITGVVNQEYQREDQGDYQQVGLPFYDKAIISELSTNFGASFNATRWSEKEILKWNNANAVFDKVELTENTASPGYGYYILGKDAGLDATTKHEILGVPYAEENTPDITLQDAAASIAFGAGGNNINAYNEKYNTYLQDVFHQGTAWEGNYGKNYYQFGNPYMTNLDLSAIGYAEGATTGDDINLSNIYGVRAEVSAVEYTQNVGGGSNLTATSNKFITFSSGIPVGDYSYLLIRPMGAFAIKLRDNTASNQTLKFDNLRRFAYSTRTPTTNYSVSAARNANSTTDTVKQLAIIGLNDAGNEVGRTYYVVYNNATTGFLENNINSTQVKAFTGSVLGSFEENPNGGYDTNVWSDYWLYINEANETDFLGKNIKVVSYSDAITSFRFEIVENAGGVPVAEGAHLLSTGIGFYCKDSNGVLKEVKNGNTIPLEAYTSSNGYSSLTYDFYYGQPGSGTLAVDEVATPSRTQVVYNPAIENYVILFDANWKKADIKVYDMSGKLVISDSEVNTSTNYIIKLDKNLKSGYVVDITADNGQKVTKKILR